MGWGQFGWAERIVPGANNQDATFYNRGNAISSHEDLNNNNDVWNYKIKDYIK